MGRMALAESAAGAALAAGQRPLRFGGWPGTAADLQRILACGSIGPVVGTITKPQLGLGSAHGAGEPCDEHRGPCRGGLPSEEDLCGDGGTLGEAQRDGGSGLDAYRDYMQDMWRAVGGRDDHEFSRGHILCPTAAPRPGQAAARPSALSRDRSAGGSVTETARTEGRLTDEFTPCPFLTRADFAAQAAACSTFAAAASALRARAAVHRTQHRQQCS